MEFSDYQEKAARCVSHGIEVSVKANLCMGLLVEAGELIDLMKKHLYHGHELKRDKVKEELGDILWYTSCLCEVNGLSLDDVAEANARKLEARYPEEFSEERSTGKEGLGDGKP